VRLDASEGSYGAANRGIASATGAYIARIDGDDLAVPTRLARQVEHIRTASDARAATSAWQLIDELGRLEPRVRPVPSTSNDVLRWRLFLRSGLVHSSLMIERAAFEELGGYGPEPVAEDFRLWCRLVRRRWLAVSDEPLVHWRRHEGQVVGRPGARDDDARLRIRLEHLRECAGDTWTIDDARDLRYLGEAAPYGWRRARSLLRRWEEAWRADASLSSDDRVELRRLATSTRLRHLRHSSPLRALRRAA
jgi:hypothetical protein